VIVFISDELYETKFQCMESVRQITGAPQKLKVSATSISDSTFSQVCGERLLFNDVSLIGSKIINANLSDLEIEGAQLGGAYLHNIGMPPKGHPAYDVNAKQRPLVFEECDLSNSRITHCNLSGIEITYCNMHNMKINGISVEDLLKTYNDYHK
jgi:uncharacterized protein YjbI with pentapeptide repeats